VRVATLFKRLLRLGRERVVQVTLIEGAEEQVLVELARPARRRMRCPHCGFQTRATYDRSVRTWRHLDAVRTRCLVACEVRRIDCPDCGVVAEEVPWARAGSRFTRAFEDGCVWLARDAPKSVVAALMRVDWATVGRMIERVVGEALERRDPLEGLRLVGVDEVAYRKGHRYLTVVVDHERGVVVWCAKGRSADTLRGFFRELGRERARLLEAVSCDMSASWPTVIAEHAPNARVCVDPFHVVALSGEALDTLRRQEWQRLRRKDPERAVWLKGTRWALRRRPEELRPLERASLALLEQENLDVYRGYLLHDQLRAIYRTRDPGQADELLAAWTEMAAGSGLAPFVKLAATIDHHREGILAAIRLGLSNGRVEAMNSTVRLLSHRSRGFRSLTSLLAMIQLVCGGIPVRLPRHGALAAA
jgi:transposase